MFQIEQLPAALGARILGLNLAAGVSEPDSRSLRRALFEHQVIVLPKQFPEPGMFASFARIFGRPEPHVLTHLRHPDFPEILPLSNVFEDGEPTGIYDGAAYWHTDMSYEDPPGAATLVHSLQAPRSGGATCFANMFRAYDSLEKSLQDQIGELQVLHHYGNRTNLDESSSTSAFPLTEAQKQMVRDVYHPLVRRHPMTGRKALYGVSGSSFGIVGMAQDEAVALLDDLASHATRDEFVYSHRYAVGDVVVWDNFSTLHSATPIPPATCPEDTRYLHRISVKAVGET
jgi:taurine dioxygenase